MPSATLWKLRGRLKELKANVPKELADQAINAAIQNVVDGRRWADLLRLGNIAIPAPYTTGTVTTAQGSRFVTGVGTTWPVTDAVSTTLGAVSYEVGYTEIAPADMTGITQGSYLLLDAGTGSEEVVVVSGTTPATFFALTRFAHDVGSQVWRSSFVGQQIRMGNTVSTIRAVHSPTSLEMDLPWAGIPVTAEAYRIFQGYVTVSPTARHLIDAWDPIAGIRIGVNKTFDWLDRWDPQRSSTGNPRELVSLPASAGGVMQWAVWPSPSSQRGINILYEDGWPELQADNDITPPFLNSEIFVYSAAADVFMTKIIARDGRQDMYYDPQAAQYYTGKYNEALERAVQADEGRYLQSLKRYSQMLTGGNGDWERSHAVYGEGYGYGGGNPYGWGSY